jgi:hypothetical protein
MALSSYASFRDAVERMVAGRSTLASIPKKLGVRVLESLDHGQTITLFVI